MKKLFLVLLALGMGLPMGAKQIDEASALKSASTFCRKGSRLKSVRSTNDLVLSYTATNANGDNLYYVFNSKSGNGFVITSADDCVPRVLGYGTSDNFDINAVNDNMRYWLENLSNEITYAIDNNQAGSAVEAAVEKASANRKPVPVIMSTKWNQDSPYNDLCPTLSNGSRAATGCVATAMAQVMNAHKWPEKGVGSHSYTSGTNNFSLRCDFENTKFDWANMHDTYKGTVTSAQKSAVATLMKACGVSIDMDYDSSSGTQTSLVSEALIQYFDYDRSIRYLRRSVVSGSEWENIIYNDLSNSMPVIFGGQSSGGGHCFVCDGYSQDGYFHFNWGWGGMSDGFFLLTALNPGSQGIGGSSTNDGFNSQQGIVYGIRKQAGTKDVYGRLMSDYGDFNCATSSVTAANSGSVQFRFGEGTRHFTSCTHYDAQVAIILAITNTATGETKYYNPRGETDNKDNYSYSKFGTKYIYSASGYMYLSAKYRNSLSNGTYTIKPMTIVEGSDKYEDFLLPAGKNNVVTMVKSASGFKFSNESSSSASLKLNDITLSSDLYVGMPAVVSVDVTSRNAEYLDDVTLTISAGDNIFGLADNVYESDPIRVSVPMGETVTLKFSTGNLDLAEGTEYEVKLLNAKNKTIGSKKFTAKAAPTDAFAFEVEKCVLGENDNMNPNNVYVDFVLKCTQGAFGGKIKAIVYASDERTPKATLSEKAIMVDAGKSFETMHTGDSKLEPNTEYVLKMFGMPSDKNSSTKVLYSKRFKTIDPSGISSIVAGDVQQVGMVTVYDVQGRELYEAEAEAFDVNDVDAKGVLIIRSQAGVTKVVK